MTGRATPSPSPTVVQIETPSLGDRSYLVHDGQVALVIDPQRDIDRVQAVADAASVRITHIFETHIHNDYLTGGLALAQSTGATYHVNADDEVSFERDGIRDGDVIEVSASLQVRAIATPGHTYTHLSYALEVRGPAGEAATTGVFTGGSLLYGATGRPDLLGTEHMHDLVRLQYESVRRLAAELPDHTQVLPTHGFGSFCSAGSTGSTGGETMSTIGAERLANPALSLGEDQWIADILAGLDAYPAYYVHMAPGNSIGPGVADLSAPRAADKATLAQSIAEGEWVIDLRTRTAFAAGHVVGTLNIGLGDQFATYLGRLIPWGTPLTILGESAAQVSAAQRELVRIGIDRLAGAATGTPGDWTDQALGAYERAEFSDLALVRHHRAVAVLDVRRVTEFTAGHIDGALNIPLHELAERLDEVPDGEVWVHCASGYRASIAASILAQRGQSLVLVDDDFAEHAAASGLPLLTTS